MEARPAHRARLQQLYDEGRLVLAGPWVDDSGAALVFDTDRAGVERILAEDPYCSTPGVRVSNLRAWSPLPLDGPGASAGG
ncbi:YciI family protein [Nocardioides sp.]|uniref:YciI family protein n=1 Tax=Nocardioides sp. TaxID=35761 RepID=UPI0039C9B039